MFFWEKLVEDLSESGDAGWNDPVSEQESLVLNKVLKLNLSNEDNSELLGPVQSEEVNLILHHEMDFDSSPGEDGITYRILKKLNEIRSFLSCMITSAIAQHRLWPNKLNRTQN